MFKPGIVASLSILLAACASTSSAPQAKPTRAPTIPSSVQVFHERPSAAYSVIGRVRVLNPKSGPNYNHTLEQRLRTAGAAQGADAVIFTPQRLKDWNPIHEAVTGVSYNHGEAIRWK